MQQGSFRIPDNCQDADCDFLVTYQASNDDSEKVVFELRGRGNWAGVGFSGDNQMVSNVDVVDLNNCINIYTETHVKLAFIECFFFQTCLIWVIFLFLQPDTDILICVSDTSLSGHYYASGRTRPTRTNPVSFFNLICFCFRQENFRNLILAFRLFLYNEEEMVV